MRRADSVDQGIAYQGIAFTLTWKAAAGTPIALADS